MRKATIAGVVAGVLLMMGAPPAHARAPWKLKIDRLIGRKHMGVAVADAGRPLYRHQHKLQRVPASNQKALLSMALFDRLGTDLTIKTRAYIRANSLPLPSSTYVGNLWLIGRGDPTLAGNRTYGTTMPFPPTHLRDLAAAIKAAGITRIEGRVMGGREYFDHDWWAYGWKADFPGDEVALPSALSVDGNLNKDHDPVARPERRAAEWLTKRLKWRGVHVTGRPGAGLPPTDELAFLTQIGSAPIHRMVSYTNRQSHNFFAEMLGKLLGARRSGPLGTIDKGARAIEAWAGKHGVEVSAYDASGLSYGNRVSPAGMVRLLGAAEAETWGGIFRRGLAGGGQGTMEKRPLKGIRVRVKTGTLDGVSTISGYVFLKGPRKWAEFSIMSRRLAKTKAVEIENKILRLVANNG